MDAEAWLAAERVLTDRDEWTPLAVRKAAVEKRRRETEWNSVGGFAERTSPTAYSSPAGPQARRTGRALRPT
jgi:hypothetical protein